MRWPLFLLLCAPSASLLPGARVGIRRFSSSQNEQASTPAAVLPSGWQSHIDPASGLTYYHHPGRGVTTWTAPTATDEPAAPTAAQDAPDRDAPARRGPPNWAEESGVSVTWERAPPAEAARQFAFSSSPPAAPAAPELDAESMTADAKARVLRQMTAAFDNYPPWEVEQMLDALWAAGIDAGPQNVSVRRLLALTDEAEAIEAEAEARARVPGASLEPLYDAMRVVRSRVRMYGKDAEFYLNPEEERTAWRWPQLWGALVGGRDESDG